MMYCGGLKAVVVIVIVLPGAALRVTPNLPESVDEESTVKSWWDNWWDHDNLSMLRAAPDDGAAKEWWDHKASGRMQHLDEAYVKNTMKSWGAFLPRFEWKGKRVLDYGIGGGYLGAVLFNKYEISSYTGVDISDKALSAARLTLTNWTDKIELRLTPTKFSDVAPEILVSQQVIQHFPSVKYFQEFLENIDNSKAKQLMIHFREDKDGKTHSTNAYHKGGQGDVLFALLTDKSFIQNHLKNYKLAWSEKRNMCCGTKGVYTGWDAI